MIQDNTGKDADSVTSNWASSDQPKESEGSQVAGLVASALGAALAKAFGGPLLLAIAAIIAILIIARIAGATIRFAKSRLSQVDAIPPAGVRPAELEASSADQPIEPHLPDLGRDIIPPQQSNKRKMFCGIPIAPVAFGLTILALVIFGVVKDLANQPASAVASVGTAANPPTMPTTRPDLTDDKTFKDMLDAIDNNRAQYVAAVLASVPTRDTSRFWGLSGYLQENQGNFGIAADDYRKAIALDPKNSSLYQRLGNALYDDSKYDEAIDSFRSCVKLDPNIIEAWQGAAWAFFQKKQYQQAIDLVNKSIALKPDDAVWHDILGTCYLCLEQYGGASEEYRKYTDLNPNDPVAWANWGTAALGLKDYQSAETYFKKCLALRPNDAYSYHWLGTVAYDTNDYATARTDWQTAIQLDPNGPDGADAKQRLQDLADSTAESRGDSPAVSNVEPTSADGNTAPTDLQSADPNNANTQSTLAAIRQRIINAIPSTTIGQYTLALAIPPCSVLLILFARRLITSAKPSLSKVAGLSVAERLCANPKCDTLNPSDAQFCRRCGSPLEGGKGAASETAAIAA